MKAFPTSTFFASQDKQSIRPPHAFRTEKLVSFFDSPIGAPPTVATIPL